MSRFLTPLRIEDTGVVHRGRVIFRVLESFDYELGAEGSGHSIHVPVGFETDYASVPRLFWHIVPPWGEYGKAAVLHDFLYRKISGFRKNLADAIFVDAMEVLGVPWWKRYVMYLGVAYFGHSSYNWEAPAPPNTEVKILDPRGEVKPEFTEPAKSESKDLGGGETFQDSVLTELVDGEKFGHELAEKLGVSPASFYRQMTALEKTGVVEGWYKENGKASLRAYRITDAGRKAVAK